MQRNIIFLPKSGRRNKNAKKRTGGPVLYELRFFNHGALETFHFYTRREKHIPVSNKFLCAGLV
jgi:hypothetical protein